MLIQGTKGTRPDAVCFLIEVTHITKELGKNKNKKTINMGGNCSLNRFRKFRC